VFELILFPGRPEERRLAVHDGVCTIGRAEDCTVSVASASMSRQHARLDIQGDRAWVSDLGSKNGTYVNEARVERSHALQPGDRVRVGEVTLRLVLAAPPADSGGHAVPGLAVPGLEPTAVRRQPSDLTAGSLDPARSAAVAANPESLPTLKGLQLPSPVAARSAEEKLRLLLRVSQLLAAPADAETIATRILDLAFQLLEADRGAVLLFEPRTHALVPVAVRNEAPMAGGAAGQGVTDETPYSRRIIDWVRTQRAAGLFSNALVDFRLAGSQSVRAAAICSAMAAPLLFADELLGVIYVDSKVAPDRYTEGDLDFLSAFANLAASALENTRLRERLEGEAVVRNNLMRFFPPTTVQKLRSEALSLRDAFATADTEITALFVDISGFTEMSTRMAPRDLMALLNAYFPPIADEVFRHEGTLEKYIGDALLAVWGAPLRLPGDADRALRAAVGMQRVLATLPLPVPLQIHVGLHTGPVAAGNIGTAEYIQYATIGEATNLAARVCAVAGAGEVVVSETTLRALTPGADVWKTTPLGPVVLKGRAEPLTLYRVEWSLE
jgi:adenylate cyclase